MTLLDASTTLVDAAKQLPGNRHLDRAIKRMEQRIQVLRLRSAKARRQRRHKAFWEAMRLMPSGVLEGTNIAIFICPQCKKTINFGTFVQHAEISGHGSIKSLFCPACDWPLFEPK